MAWSYRKRVKLIPGIHLNFSKRGISTTIGVRGASLTIGKSGTFLNTGIPGTGLYSREKISSNNQTPKPQIDEIIYQQEPSDNIFSVDLQEITSQDLQGIKETILAARKQRIELLKDLNKIEYSLWISQFLLIVSYLFLIPLIQKNTFYKIKADINTKKDASSQVKEMIQNSRVNLEIEFDPEIGRIYSDLTNSFNELAESRKIWDVTGAYHQDRRVTRSFADTTVKRRIVQFGSKELEDIKSPFDTLWMKNANGGDIYIYPNFIVMYSNRSDFAVVGFNELKVVHTNVSFLETSSIPSDSKIIDYTWAKVNKNGSRDKRFKDNYQIPVVRYGEIAIRTENGLHEEYQFSNYEASEDFYNKFNYYQRYISSLKLL